MNHTKPKNKKNNLETELTSIALYDFRNAKREREREIETLSLRGFWSTKIEECGQEEEEQCPFVLWSPHNTQRSVRAIYL